MDLMEVRRTMMGVIAGMAENDWTITLKPVDNISRIIPALTFAVTVGQKITISWKSDALYTNRYFMRALTAVFDNGSQYELFAPAMYGLSGTKQCVVTSAGNIVFGGYGNGLAVSNLLGDYVKIKIENPEE